MHTKNLLITLSAILLLASTTLYAETPKQTEVPPCSTSVECDVMAKDLQGKIDVLEAKIKEEKDPKTRFFLQQNKSKLQDKKFDIMIAQAKARTAQAKARTAQVREELAQQRKIIAQENAKQAELRKSQDKKLDEIRALLK